MLPRALTWGHLAMKEPFPHHSPTTSDDHRHLAPQPHAELGPHLRTRHPVSEDRPALTAVLLHREEQLAVHDGHALQQKGDIIARQHTGGLQHGHPADTERLTQTQTHKQEQTQSALSAAILPTQNVWHACIQSRTGRRPILSRGLPNELCQDIGREEEEVRPLQHTSLVLMELRWAVIPMTVWYVFVPLPRVIGP